MHKYLPQVIDAYYKQCGLYDTKIKYIDSNGSYICLSVDIIHKRLNRDSHGYVKRCFYDYLSKQELTFGLADYVYDNRIEGIINEEAIEEKGVIIIGSIEVRRVRSGHHTERQSPLFLTSKSKFTINFKNFIKETSKNQSPCALYKELSFFKKVRISRASIYSLLKQ